jgi:hypothetical protein
MPEPIDFAAPPRAAFCLALAGANLALTVIMFILVWTR